MKKKVKDFLAKVRFSTIRLLRSNVETSPGYLGRTFAIGMSVGIFFFMGQLAIVTVLWLLLDRLLKLRFSLLIACLITFISNPLTSPFIIYIFYMTGSMMLGSAAVSFVTLTHRLRGILDNWDLVDGIGILFRGVGKPIIYGSIPWHIIMAVAGYWIGVSSYKKFKKTVHIRKMKILGIKKSRE
jgi:uncharacterized protein (DUF2062 family)